MNNYHRPVSGGAMLEFLRTYMVFLTVHSRVHIMAIVTCPKREKWRGRAVYDLAESRAKKSGLFRV